MPSYINSSNSLITYKIFSLEHSDYGHAHSKYQVKLILTAICNRWRWALVQSKILYESQLMRYYKNNTFPKHSCHHQLTWLAGKIIISTLSWKITSLAHLARKIIICTLGRKTIISIHSWHQHIWLEKLNPGTFLCKT